MKLFILLTLALAVAGCGDTKAKKNARYPDVTTDFSSTVISEKEMNNNGCLFQGITSQVVCSTPENRTGVFLQKLSLLNWTADFSVWSRKYDPRQDKRPMNANSITAIYNKARQVRVYIVNQMLVEHEKKSKNKQQNTLKEEAENFVINFIQGADLKVDFDIDQLKFSCVDCKSRLKYERSLLEGFLSSNAVAIADDRNTDMPFVQMVIKSAELFLVTENEK